MQFPMSVKWFELLRKRAGEFRMTPPDRIFRQVQNELPGQAIPGLKERAESFVVQPSAGLFEGIQAGLVNPVIPSLQNKAEAFRLEPSAHIFEKIQQQLPGQAIPSLADKAADYRVQPSDKVFLHIQRRLRARRRRRAAALLFMLLMLGSTAWFLPSFLGDSGTDTANETASQYPHSTPTPPTIQHSSIQVPDHQERREPQSTNEAPPIGPETENKGHSNVGNTNRPAANKTGLQPGNLNSQAETSKRTAPSKSQASAEKGQSSGLAGKTQGARSSAGSGNHSSQPTKAQRSDQERTNKQAAGASGLAGGQKSKATPSFSKREIWEPLELKWEKYQAQRIEPVFSWSSFDTRWKRPHIEKVYLRTPQRRPARFSVRGQFEATALVTQMAFSENPDYQGKKSSLLNPSSYNDLESRLQTPDFSYQVQAGLELGFRSVYLRTGLSLLRLTYQQNDLYFEHKALIVNVPVTDTLTFTTSTGVDTTVVYSYNKPELKDVLDTTRITYAARATYVSIPLAFGYRYERGRWFAQADLGVAVNLFVEGRGLAYMAAGATVLSPTSQADQALWNNVGLDATARLKAGWKLSRRWSAAVHIDLRMGLRPVYSPDHALHQTYSGMGLGFSLNHKLY